jgi:hypothetical protein
VNKASEEVAPVTPRYQSIRALATSHQVEASRLMGLGQFKEAGDLLDKAISLLNTVPEKHRLRPALFFLSTDCPGLPRWETL